MAPTTRKLAHDLKNLMTVITLSAELIRSESGSEASRAELLTRIEEAAEAAVFLTRRLMAFGGDFTPTLTPDGSADEEGSADGGAVRSSDHGHCPPPRTADSRPG